MSKVPAFALTLFAVVGCADRTPDAEAEDSTTESAIPAALGSGNVVEITARGRTLEAPTEIASGWTTLRLHNDSEEAHFVVLERLPEGRTVADSRAEVVPVFQNGLDLLSAGKDKEALAEFGRLPAWYADVVVFGGPGIVSGGVTGQTSLYLEPGTYAIECYVKTGGRFHSADGMISQLVVTEAAGGGHEPTAPLELTVTGAGIALDGIPQSGVQSVKVTFDEQMVHEHFLGTDVHLVRLGAEPDTAALASWMNWINPGGLATPAPGRFLGGTQEMPAGQAAYFMAPLTPGQYAFVAEVPEPSGKGMLLTFTVPAAEETSESGT
ncbi:MAG TPA: hypothetical protein VFS94_07245 [Gemmatimonadales bacterium]|nr:hypothetical protein [Gemmatimonadales bacterium]